MYVKFIEIQLKHVRYPFPGQNCDLMVFNWLSVVLKVSWVAKVVTSVYKCISILIYEIQFRNRGTQNQVAGFLIVTARPVSHPQLTESPE